jgi:hypothetical protein
MLRTYQFAIILTSFFILSGYSQSKDGITIKITNELSFDRSSETVKINISDLHIILSDFNNLEVREQKNGKVILSQLSDSDGDGRVDELLFQPVVEANGEVRYMIVQTNESVIIESKVYSRFVPERTDDYAWENDRVAFRTYGPVAQKMKEEGDPNGTLSSGIDCWLKKVDYPIINKWYLKHTSGTGSYHKDTGEGFDPYHVGSSRGCGGLGVWHNENLFVSKNFTNYNTLSNGPIRTRFMLDYADWSAGDKKVKERKQISLDLGNNLMHVADYLAGIDEVTVGITLHENEGETNIDTLNYCFSYWEPMKGSEMGTGIVVEPKYYKGVTKFISEEPEKSQLLVHLKVIDGKVEYYAGFAWKESNQYKNKEEWEKYLSNFSQILANPLVANKPIKASSLHD